MDFRTQLQEAAAPIHIDGAKVEKVSCFKFLGVFIKDDLTWSRQVDSAVRTAQKRLYFLRRLKKFGMSAKTHFYRCTMRTSSLAALLAGTAAALQLIARPSRGW